MRPDNHTPDDDWEDEVDPIQRLRAANPVLPADVPRLATTARARALRTELIMQTDIPPSTDPEAATSTTWHRAVLAGAALVALALGSIAVVLDLTADTPEDVVAGDEADAPVDAPAVDEELVDPAEGGGSMAMCAFSYSPETLTEREVAFVGTVTAVEGDAITFDVEEVLRGDIGATVTLGGGEFLVNANPDNVNPIATGQRLLVAGDGGFAWGCGFTQPYDEAVAAEWRATLG